LIGEAAAEARQALVAPTKFMVNSNGAGSGEFAAQGAGILSVF
jgi:hypothetical protein